MQHLIIKPTDTWERVLGNSTYGSSQWISAAKELDNIRAANEVAMKKIEAASLEDYTKSFWQLYGCAVKNQPSLAEHMWRACNIHDVERARGAGSKWSVDTRDTVMNVQGDPGPGGQG